MKDLSHVSLVGTLTPDQRDEYYLTTTESQHIDISDFRGSYRVTDLDAISWNYRQIREIVHKKIIAVVKARAYGCGLASVAKRLRDEGCDFFAVATIGAACALRESVFVGNRGTTNNVSEPTILVLGHFPPEILGVARDLSLTVTISDPDIWCRYEEEIRREAELFHEKPVRFAINLDTGMSRLGVPVRSGNIGMALQIARKIRDCRGATLHDLYTHLALADQLRDETSEAEEVTLSQIRTTEEVVRALDAEGAGALNVHVANSKSIEQYQESYSPDWITHVRAGGLIYGLAILDHQRFRRSAKWCATLARVERMIASGGIGYGHEYHATAGQLIGTLSVGFADGYLPAKEGQMNWVRLNGIALPVIGRVSMDMCMVDLEPYVAARGVSPEPGDVVDLLSSEQGPEDLISAENLGRRWGLSRAIVLSGIRTRVSAIYTSKSTHP